MSRKHIQTVEPPSGKMQFPNFQSFKLGKPDPTPYWAPEIGERVRKNTPEELGILLQYVVEERMQQGAVVTKRARQTGGHWRMSSHYHWGRVTHIRTENAHDDKIVFVQWFVPSNQGNLQTESVSPYDLIVIYQSYTDQELTEVIRAQLMT